MDGWNEVVVQRVDAGTRVAAGGTVGPNLPRFAVADVANVHGRVESLLDAAQVRQCWRLRLQEESNKQCARAEPNNHGGGGEANVTRLPQPICSERRLLG